MRGTLRRTAYDIVEPGLKGDTLSIAFDRVAVAAILASVAVAVILTMPELAPALRDDLLIAQWCFGLFFAAEYAVRLWTAPEQPLFERLPAWQARLRYVATPFLILDALGVAPLILMILAPGAAGPILILQILRFFRLARYSPALASVGRVLVNEWRPLVATGVIGLGILLVAASLMYLLEHDAQPEHFGSMPDAMYWAVVTLATVGYGDVVPVTPLGKIATGGVIVAGLIFFALPIAIIATGYLAEIRRRDFNIGYGMVARVPLFAGLDARELSELTSMLKSRKLPRDAMIVRKGEEGDCMYFIANGEAEVVLPTGSVRLGEGDYFGEMAVLGRTTRNATVIARRPCELLVLDAADVLKFVERNPRFEAELHEAVAKRRGTG